MDKYDMIIIGGGPAGLTAAIYGARAKLRTLVINKGVAGGQAHTTREIVNYPGYEHTDGPTLMKSFKAQALGLGAELIQGEVQEVDFSVEDKVITTKRGQKFSAPAVILAGGTKPRLLNVPGEKRLKGSGVAYCATCDAEFFEDEDVVVVGSSDQAIEEGMFITKFAKSVTVIVLHDEGVLDCNKLSADKALQNEKMKFVWNSTIEEVVGKQNVEAVRIKNLKTSQISDLVCQGVFFFVGMIPATEFLATSGLTLDQRGYIPVNEQMETNIEGVYAVGDIRVKYLRQIVTAAGDGAAAAVAAERYLEELHYFKENVLASTDPVVLYFFDPMVPESLNFNQAGLGDIGNNAKVINVDISRKKFLASKYNVNEVPKVLVISAGEIIRG